MQLTSQSLFVGSQVTMPGLRPKTTSIGMCQATQIQRSFHANPKRTTMVLGSTSRSRQIEASIIGANRTNQIGTYRMFQSPRRSQVCMMSTQGMQNQDDGFGPKRITFDAAKPSFHRNSQSYSDLNRVSKTEMKMNSRFLDQRNQSIEKMNVQQAPTFGQAAVVPKTSKRLDVSAQASQNATHPRTQANNIEMKVTYEIEPKSSSLTEKETKELIEVYQDEVFDMIDKTESNQEKIDAILAKCEGDMTLAYEQIHKNPELYQQVLHNLDAQIEYCYQKRVRDCDAIYQKIDRVFHGIETCLQKSDDFQQKYKIQSQENGFEGYYLSKFGSSVNGTLSKNSDLDMTLVTDDSSFNIIQMVKDITKALEENQTEPGRYKFNEKKYGNVVLFEDTVEDLSVDFCINRTANIVNSNLIYQYSKMDVRFKKLMYFFKDWMKLQPQQPDEKLNHFSIYCMLIAYMQSEKMLPNLQAMAQISFKGKDNEREAFEGMIRDPKIDTHQIRNAGKLMFDRYNNYYDTFEDLKANFQLAGLDVTLNEDSPMDIRNFFEHTGQPKENLQTPAEIFIGFLKYYGQTYNVESAVDISQMVAQKNYKVNPFNELKENVLDIYYKGEPYPPRSQLKHRVERQYQSRKFFQDLKLPQDFMDNIQRKYKENWNEIGPEELTDQMIYDKHQKLIDSEASDKLKAIEKQPYYFIDPFDHLYNPAQCVTKYNCEEWLCISKQSYGEGEVLYPDVWNNSLRCIFENKIKSKFSKKKQ